MVDRYGSRGVFKNCGNNCSGVRQKCACGEKNECQKLLEKLREIDFSLIDTVLYLDAYPDSCEALAYYGKLKCERADIVKKLSESCNMPQTAFDNASTTQWQWTDAPWPWEKCAN